MQSKLNKKEDKNVAKKETGKKATAPVAKKKPGRPAKEK